MREYPLLEQQLPVTIKKVWLKRLLTTTISFIIFGGITAAVCAYFMDVYRVIIMLLGVYLAVVVIIALLSFSLRNYRYNFCRYEIASEQLAFQRGYIFR